MKSALKTLSLSLLVFVPVFAHEGCSKTTQTHTETKQVAVTVEETTETTRKPALVTEVAVAQSQEVAPKAEVIQTAEVTETIKN